MNSIIYKSDLKAPLCNEFDCDLFRKKFLEEQKAECSQCFLDFCRSDNGGLLVSGRFIPLKKYKMYYLYVKGRVLNRVPYIEIRDMLGVCPVNDRFSLESATDNARNVWELKAEFFVIAKDPYGFRIVSKLRQDDSQVYFWEPHVEPHFFLIADTLSEFYSNIISG